MSKAKQAPSESTYTTQTDSISGDMIHAPEQEDIIAVHSKNDEALHTVDPKEEYRYWENNYVSGDVSKKAVNFASSYGPAYRFGIHAFSLHGGRAFDEIDENVLKEDWKNSGLQSSLSWEEVKTSIRNAYERLSNR